MNAKKTSPTKLKELCVLPERDDLASPKRTLCHECGRYEQCGDPFVRTDTKGWNGQLLLLFGQRVSGETVEYLRALLNDTGYVEADYCFLDAVRCYLPKSPTTFQMRACRSFFVEFILRHRPVTVLALGNVAARLATNDGKLKTLTPVRGTSYLIPGCEEVKTTLYVTYDIEEIIEKGSYHNEPRIKEDLLRARKGGLRALAAPKEGLPRGTTVSVDTEFMPDGRVVTLSAADRVSGDCRDVTDRTGATKILRHLNQAAVFVGHNVAVDLDSVCRLARQSNMRISGLETWLAGKQIVDTLALARMADENRGKGGYKLDTLLRSDHHAPEWKEDDRVEDLSNPESWPQDYRIERCRLDAWAAAVLCDKLTPHAQGPLELTHRIIETLRRIYHTGAAVDLAYAKNLTKTFYHEATKAKRVLTAAASKFGMTEFSPTNDNDLRTLLFEKCKLKGAEKTKTGLASVNKTFLKQHKEHELVKTLLEFNTHDKRYSTYGTGLAKKFLTSLTTGDARRGMLRFRVNPLGARTGRRASDKPNAQNWPKDVRKIIISRWDDGAIADNDYSKLEILLFAWTAREWKLLEFFLEGNGYIAVGKELFNKEVKEDTDDYRTVKSVVLGIQYGMGAWKLAYQLWNNVGVKFSSDWDTHVEAAARIRQTYLTKFPGISRYMRAQKTALLQSQCVTSLTGRVRHLPCPYGEETPGFGHLLNQAINFPIQSLASDVTGSAMVDTEERLLDLYNLTYEEYHYRLMVGKYPVMPLLINEVHDDLVFDIPKKKRKENLALISETMAEVPTLRALCPAFDLPLNTGQKVGSRWGLDDMKGGA